MTAVIINKTDIINRMDIYQIKMFENANNKWAILITLESRDTIIYEYDTEKQARKELISIYKQMNK